MRLPRVIANQPFNTGRGTMPDASVDDSIGRGLASIGAGVSAFGQVLAERQARADNFAAEAAVIRFTGEQNQRMLAAAENLPPGGMGFATQQREAFNLAATTFINTEIPEALRPEVFNRLLQLQNNVTDQAARIEYAENTRFYTAEVNNAGNQVAQSVMMSPYDLQVGMTEIDRLIDLTNLPTIERENLRTDWHNRLVEASITGLIRADPNAAYIALGGTAPPNNLVVGLSPTYRTAALEAAAATGINPNYLAMTVGAESGNTAFIVPRTPVQPAGQTMTAANFQSRYYRPENFQSHDGAPLAIDPNAVAALDNMTQMLGGVPLTITSAHRSESHNSSPQVNGASNSQHLHGTAFDIQLPSDSNERRRILSAAIAAGFTGFGFYAETPNMLHIDTRGTPASWYWGGGDRAVPEWAIPVWDEYQNTANATGVIGNDTTNAQGPFQFIPETFVRLMHANGGKYNYSLEGMTDEQILELRGDPRAATLMAAEYAAENRALMEPALGRNVSLSELYLGHFMGGQGAVDLIRAVQANPDTIAATLFESAATANRSVFYDGDRPRTVREVYAEVDRRFQAQGAAGQVPQGQVAPQYSGVPFDRVNNFLGQAEAGINDRITQAAAQEANRQTVAAQDYTNRVSSVQRRIYEEPDYGHADLRAEDLNDDDYVRLARQIDERDGDTSKLAAAMARYADPNSRYTPANAEDRAQVDLLWQHYDPNNEGLLEMAPEAADALSELIRRTEIAPVSAMQQLMAMSRRDDPAEMAYALTLAARIYEEAPDAMIGETEGFMADVLRWNNLTQAQAFDFEAAAARMIEDRVPMTAERQRQMGEAVTEFVGALELQEVLQHFDDREGNIAGLPDAGFTVEGEIALLSEYQNFAREAFLHEAQGDPVIARQLALRTMSQLYGVTRILDGTPTIMRHPPERAYGPVGEGMTWFNQQFQTQATIYFGREIPLEDLVLMTYPVTDRDVQSGAQPRYAFGAWFDDGNGIKTFHFANQAINFDMAYAQSVQDTVDQVNMIQAEEVARVQDERVRNQLAQRFGQAWLDEGAGFAWRLYQETRTGAPGAVPNRQVSYVPYEMQAAAAARLGRAAPDPAANNPPIQARVPIPVIPVDQFPTNYPLVVRPNQPNVPQETEPLDRGFVPVPNLAPGAAEQRGPQVVTDPNQMPAIPLPGYGNQGPGATVIQGPGGPVPVPLGHPAAQNAPAEVPEPTPGSPAANYTPTADDLLRPDVETLDDLTIDDYYAAVNFLEVNGNPDRNPIDEAYRIIGIELGATPEQVDARIRALMAEPKGKDGKPRNQDKLDLTGRRMSTNVIDQRADWVGFPTRETINAGIAQLWPVLEQMRLEEMRLNRPVDARIEANFAAMEDARVEYMNAIAERDTPANRRRATTALRRFLEARRAHAIRLLGSEAAAEPYLRAIQ